MVHRYIPILRWKRGERVAVEHLSVAGRADVAPLFLLGTDQYVGKAATKQKPAVSAPDATAKELMNCWGSDPLFIDAAALPSSGGGHPITAIAASARVRGVTLIPATTLGAPAAYQAAVDAVVKIDKLGVALRVDMNEFTSVAHWIGSWPYAAGDTDLILDCADTISAVNSLGAAVNPAFTGLHAGNQWRTVTLCGTSMLENFVGFAAGQYLIKRVEVPLWKKLSALALPYRLDYGDYATVSTAPPPAGIKWGYPINVKYTLKDNFFVCRGVGTTGAGAVDADAQLIGHAKTIAAYASRNALAGCWGDERIDAVASGKESPQGLEHWVRISVNRHIEITRHHLP